MKKKPITRNTIQSLEEVLQGPKPGLAAQLIMMPHPRPGNRIYSEVEDSCLKAGVLILLYPVNDKLHVVFTRRTSRVDFHQAQISFPGGQQEQDESFKEAAVRSVQYYKQIKQFYQSKVRKKHKQIARTLVTQEIAKACYYVLKDKTNFNNTFKSVTLSRSKTMQWPRLANPDA